MGVMGQLVSPVVRSIDMPDTGDPSLAVTVKTLYASLSNSTGCVVIVSENTSTVKDSGPPPSSALPENCPALAQLSVKVTIPLGFVVSGFGELNVQAGSTVRVTGTLGLVASSKVRVMEEPWSA